MKKKNIMGLLFLILLMPIVVLAEEEAEMIGPAYIWELFSSIHVSIFFLLPLKEFLKNKGIDIPFWILFVTRVVLLLFITPFFPFIFLVEFCLMFVGPFLSGGKINVDMNMNKNIIQSNPVETPKGLLICPKCGKEMAYGNTRCSVCGENLQGAKYICPQCHTENITQARFCKACGNPLYGVSNTYQAAGMRCPYCNEILLQPMKFCKYCGKNVEKETSNMPTKANTGTPFAPVDFDPNLVSGNEIAMVRKLIKQEMEKDPSLSGKTIPSIEKRKLLITVIYAIILFIITTLYVAYHTYLGLDILLLIITTGIFVYMTYNYRIEKYIEKEVNKRPDEKISYIASSVLSSATTGGHFTLLIQIGLIALTIAGIIYLYKEPHMIYEHQSNGYHLRYYTYGILKTEREITIPQKYKNESVVGIRGDVFKNVSTVEKVNLPSTIVEIRGGAFQNCTRLKGIDLPTGIDEIHGSTFEGCTRLEKIEIPEGVTRIGGSAFRDCTNLKEATIPKTVTEIGSSAFRNTSLSKVCISRSTSVNERAFKETYPEIVYYENNCESDQYGDYYYDY